ncbi:ribonuclease HIII [Staphylococcus muscae]|uniref:Ribonuclease HIII n=1 Tax=Staphylococcus muscae TaxID=1294 RepID=A0A240C1C5_9STAP|nr:ribonuclease HIII [Staphylococcus muscae]AVQ32757.1 ribonuclease HIII [Staphylococcus muscae]PNZ05329.1 ribonuclease HIII [Staphylococcus muscae]GGA81406.1 ribonuclease HIII [Staphylococcus muscae]SNW01549.1 ribonuclease HIII [Staphylococcus muscae]
MSNLVMELSTEEVIFLRGKLKAARGNYPPGMIFRSKYQGVTISIYNSKKAMFQGANNEKVAMELLGRVTPSPSKKSKNTSSHSANINYNTHSCIGSDEAGSGDYFGPLTVCACYVSKEHVEVLKALGVDDSKKLTDTKIVELAEQLVTFLPHSLLVLDNPKYNERKAMNWSQVKMKAVLHNECIKNVLQKIDAKALDYIVIDQFTPRPTYERYAIGDVPLKNKTCYETKGESKSLAIAAASIISRYAFVKHMDALSKQYRTTILKGAGPKVDVAAAKLMAKHGIDEVDSITKKDFKNREKALKILEKRYKDR